MAVDICKDARLGQFDAKVDKDLTISLRLPDRNPELVVVNVPLLLDIPFLNITRHIRAL